MTVKELIQKCILIGALLTYSILIVSSNYTEAPFSFYNSITFFIIGLISIIEITRDTYNYSLNKIHWYFIFIFMFLSPIAQLSSGYFPWDYKISNSLILQANIILICWELTYILGYRYLKQKKNHNYTKSPQQGYTHNSHIIISPFLKFFLIFSSLLSVIMMIRRSGFYNLFLRDTDANGGGTFSILFTYLFRATPAISSSILILAKRKGNNISNLLITITLLCTFILNSPFALSRYWVGSVYLGLLFCIVPPALLKNRRFDYLIILVLAFLFPLFSFFKYNTLATLLNSGIKLNILGIYNNVDFDAYSMLCRIIEYTKTHGFTLGSQIKSVILFFIPRTILNVKGEPTGSLVSSAQKANFTNLSAPIMGEGYIDFSFIGVFAFAFFSSRFLRNLDRKYWNYQSEKSVTYTDIIFVYLIGFTIFIMRGALQPSFLRAMGFFLFLIIVFIIQKITKL